MNTNGASNFVDKVDFSFYFIIGISVILLIAVTVVMIMFAIKYSRKRNPKATQIEGDTRLEILWTVIPTILVLAMFYFGWTGYVPLRNVPDDAMKVDVTGRMWSWTFEYENGKKNDRLVVPLGQAVVLNMTSLDVVHSFYVPAFRVKEDVNPGGESYLWFEAQELGSYDIYCAEYCGLRHSYMITKLDVVPQEEFDAWVVEGFDPNKEKDPIQEGYEITRSNGCIGCHSTDGSVIVSSSFKGLYGSTRTVVTDGEERQITIDDAYIKKSILDPGADLVKGIQPVMPPYAGTISNEDIDKILMYIKSLNE
jgi:cytochrome c oxidase subunit II